MSLCAPTIRHIRPMTRQTSCQCCTTDRAVAHQPCGAVAAPPVRAASWSADRRFPAYSISLRGVGRRSQAIAVPTAPNLPKSPQHALGNMVRDRTVQPKTERRAAGQRQRDVVPRQIDPFESIVLLEIGEAVPLFVAVGKVRVHEVRNLSFSTGP